MGRRGRPPKSVGNEELDPKSPKRQTSVKTSMETIDDKKLKPSTAKNTPRRKSVSTSAVASTSKLEDTPQKKRGRPSKSTSDETMVSKSPKKSVTLPKLADTKEEEFYLYKLSDNEDTPKKRRGRPLKNATDETIESKSPTKTKKGAEKSPSTSRRKSVSASAVPQKLQKSPTSKNPNESKASRSRSQSSSTKILDVMFTPPVKIKGATSKKEASKKEEDSKT